MPRMPKLRDVAHARSGDKGSDANVGVIAHTPAGYELIARVLTPERVRRHLAPVWPAPVARNGVAPQGPRGAGDVPTAAPSDRTPVSASTDLHVSASAPAGPVTRYELPNLGALNFVLAGILDGGASRSLRIDPQGKALGQVLLEMDLPEAADRLPDFVRRATVDGRAIDNPVKDPLASASLPARPTDRAIRPEPVEGHGPVASSASGFPMTNPVLCQRRRGAALVLSMNRPDRRNALNREMIRALSAGLAEGAADPSVRVVVLAGEGSAFCAGMDLEVVAGEGTGQVAAGGVPTARPPGEELLELLRSLAELPKPTIAAVHGPAVAGGAGLMSACDVVLAEPAARIGYPEVRRGLVAAMVMAFLVRQVGDRAARELLLGGELMSAARAAAVGLVTGLCEAGGLWAEVDAWMGRLSAGGPEALARTKMLLSRLGQGPLDGDLTMAHETHLAARLGAEAREGVAAFLARRPPAWVPAGAVSAKPARRES